jgi:hypothetical protein
MALATSPTAPRYHAPRALDAPDWFIPGLLTMSQAAWTAGGLAAGYWAFQTGWLQHAEWTRPWLVIYLPLFGILAKRKVGTWDLWTWTTAWCAWLCRPRHTLY